MWPVAHGVHVIYEPREKVLSVAYDSEFSGHPRRSGILTAAHEFHRAVLGGTRDRGLGRRVREDPNILRRASCH